MPWRPELALLITGLSTFASAYLIHIPVAGALATDAGSKHGGEHAATMAIPVAGPFLEASGAVQPQSANVAAGFVALGALQIGGIVLTVLGLALGERTSAPTPTRGATAPPTSPVRLTASGLSFSF